MGNPKKERSEVGVLKAKEKELFRNSVIFGIGVIGAKLMQFLLVPLYTIYLTSADYSTSDLTLSSVSLIMPFLTLGMAHGILRFSIGKPQNRKSVLQFALSCSMVGTTILIIAVPLIQMTGLFKGFEWYIPVLFLFGSLKSTLSNYCKSLGKNRLYAIEGIISATTIAILSWILLGALSIGIHGYLLAYVLSYAISVLYYFPICHVFQTLKEGKYSSQILHETLRYSIPLMPNDLAWWIMQMSDRYMVTWWCGASINGIYSIAYKIPGIFNVLISVFMQALSLTSFQEFDTVEQTNSGRYDGTFFSGLYRRYISVIFVAAGLVIISSQPLAWLLLKNDFYNSWRYTAVLLLAFVLESLEAFYASILCGIKKTHICLISTTLAAIVNIGVNIVVIPKYQGFGAVFSTVISYFIVFIIRLIATIRFVDMDTFNAYTFTSLFTITVLSISYVSSLLYIRLISIFCFIIIIVMHRDSLIELLKRIYEIVSRIFISRKMHKQ